MSTFKTVEQMQDEIKRLTRCLKGANANHEHFEREWYLAGFKIEAQAAQIKRLREALTDMVALFSADDLLTERGALIPVGHALKAARAALQAGEGDQ